MNAHTNITRSPSALARLALTVLALPALLLIGCDTAGPDEPRNIVLDDPITVPFFMVDEHGGPVTDPAERVYEIRTGAPATDPDGKHLTLAELSTVRGQADITCTSSGTYVDLDLTGLIPGGVYTIWNVTFLEGGFDPAKEMMNIRGLGALGRGDGSENGFVASPTGTARISAITPGGALSMMGDIEACALDELEYHLIGALHLDGRTHGGDLGPDGTALEQFGFIYTPE